MELSRIKKKTMMKSTVLQSTDFCPPIFRQNSPKTSNKSAYPSVGLLLLSDLRHSSSLLENSCLRIF